MHTSLARTASANRKIARKIPVDHESAQKPNAASIFVAGSLVAVLLWTVRPITAQREKPSASEHDAAVANVSLTFQESLRDDPITLSTSSHTAREEDALVPIGHAGVYVLQVSSEATNDTARALALSLRTYGYAAFVMRALHEDRDMTWRVRIGPFDTMREAKESQARLEQSLGINSYPVRGSDDG